MSSYYEDAKFDTWALGVVCGCYQVHQAHQPYPALLAFWVRRALKRIKTRKLKCSKAVIAFCEEWITQAETSLGQCHCKCHRQPRRKQQRWRSS